MIFDSIAKGFARVSYCRESMTIWQYYDCGKGKKIDYSGLEFVSGLLVLQEFEGSDNIIQTGKSKKQRADRSLCTGIYCNKPNCLMYFKTEADYNKHMKQGNKHMKQGNHFEQYEVLLKLLIVFFLTQTVTLFL